MRKTMIMAAVAAAAILTFGGTASAANLFGDDGNNAITGTSQADLIKGFGGADILSGAGGDDRVEGGAGRDDVGGNQGNDTLIGGSGKDVFTAGIGDDFLEARDGIRDIVDCGPGFDTVKADIGVDSVDSDCESVS